MSNAAIEAEERVATYLADAGWKILARNWRDRFCEIDIVATANQRVHIVEVKYRTHTGQGAGHEYITTDKRRRLRRAALRWAQANNYTGDMQIDVASVAGEEFMISYIENAVEGF